MLLPRHKPLGESSDLKSRVNLMCGRQREKVLWFFRGGWGWEIVGFSNIFGNLTMDQYRLDVIQC